MLARKLNCPVLSYDSDFYIFDGQYIPYVTITPKVYKKTVTSNKFEVEIVSKKRKGQKNVKRKTKKIVVQTGESNEPVDEVTYNYLDCCMYTIENLTDGVLENDMLPLFAIMLGNDFISRKWFAKFFRNVSRRTIKKKKNLSPQQKKIYTLLNWLQHETLRTAIKKILECVKHYQRPKLWYQIRNAMRGYKMTHSKSFDYFGFEEQSFEQEDNPVLHMDLEELMLSDDEEENDSEEEEEENATEEETSEVENVDSNEEAEDENISDSEIPGLENENEVADGFEVKDSEDDDFQDPNEGILSDEDDEPEPVRRRKFVFPEWFQSAFNSGSTPRFLVDVFRCRRYINYPQVEDFAGNDSNAISYPILNLLYSLLHSPETPPLFYYTRVPKQVRYEVKKIEQKSFPTVIDYDPNEKKNIKFLNMIYEKQFTNANEIFEAIKEIPEAHQLYILAVIYWMKRSSSTSSLFLQTVIIGIIAISVIDKKCEKVHRDGAKFLKNFDKYLKELKANESLVDNDDAFKDVPLKSVIKNVTKQESLLTLENLINHYSISPKFQRKHADFRRNVVHTFSELQSVVFNLFSLNPFLNYPFENIKIENYFNGLFLYNMYLNLKARANSIDYIKGYIFNHSPALMMVFNRIYEICKIALPDLKHETSETLEVPKKTKVKKIKKPKSIVNVTDDCIGKISDSDHEFEDLNNKFSQLLKI